MNSLSIKNFLGKSDLLATKSIDVKRRFIVLNLILAIGCFFLLLLIAISYLQKNYIVMLVDIFMFFILMFMLLRVRKTIKVYFYSLWGIGCLLVFYVYLFIDGSEGGGAFLWIYTFPLGSIFLLGDKLGLKLSLLLIFITTLFYSLSAYIPFQYPYDFNLIIRFIPSYLVVVLFAWAMEKARSMSEKSMKEAAKIAESANRAKSEFLANMSHEIRTPLNAILGFSELLSDMVSDSKEINYLNSIKVAGKSLLTLINDILDLSKMEAGKMEMEYNSIDIKSIFIEIEQIFQQNFKEKNLTFILDIDKNLPEYLILDETRIRQVLLNIVGNAVKFTNQGSITLGVNGLYKNESRTKVDLKIFVKDTGIGIPQKNLKNIFEAFKQQEGQSTRNYGGTGLGLTISNKLIEMMNGKIRVISEEKKGTQFEIFLDDITTCHSNNTDKQTVNSNYENIVFDEGKILIVDDVVSNRDVIGEMLKKHNLKVIKAINGQEAILIAKEVKPDLILMDIMMPVMNGIDATKTLKNTTETKNIPTIALTASMKSEKKDNDLSKIFDGFLYKPVTKNLLVQKLSEFLPYSITEDKTIKEDLSAKIPNIDNIVMDDELFEIMKNTVSPKITELQNTMIFDDIVEFSKTLNQLGEKYNLPIMVQYSHEIELYGENFDVKNVDKMLKTISLFLQKAEKETI